MTESDFDALEIRLGDRRKLQREIARRQSWPANSPLPTSDELREYTLSLQEDAAEVSKNGYFQQHITETESESVPSELAGISDEDVCLSLFPVSSSSMAVLIRTQGSPMVAQAKGPGSVAETSQSSDTIPLLELDAEINDQVYDTAEAALNHLSANMDIEFDDDPTPRPAENRAVSTILSP